MSNRKNIIYLGSSHFPYGLAATQKMILISQSLLLSENTVTVLCKKGVYNERQIENVYLSNYKGINIVYFTGSIKPKGFIRRNILKVTGFLREIWWLRDETKKRGIDFAILTTHNVYETMWYIFLSKVFRFKTILNYVEYHSDLEKKWHEFNKRINNKLYDKLAPKYSDLIFPISEYLIQHVQKVSPGKPYLKIPGLTDFDRYNDIVEVQGDYFLFCGAAAYKEIIFFIIDSYQRLGSIATQLYLVTNGSEQEMQEVASYIERSASGKNIRVLSRLTDQELYGYYKQAKALLIPLRPTLKDIARFPHKTGEYLGSGNPVISTNYGEMKKYFTDGKDMLLAEEYDVRQFSKKMRFVLDHPEIARKIGLQGQRLGWELFDYKHKALEINSFLNLQQGLKEEVLLAVDE